MKQFSLKEAAWLHMGLQASVQGTIALILPQKKFLF